MDKRLLDKVEIKSPTVRKNLTEAITTLRQSCFEGSTGAWDASTQEGREGFDSMVEATEVIAEYLGISLPDLPEPEEE